LELLSDALMYFTPPDHASSLVVKYEAYIGVQGGRRAFARRGGSGVGTNLAVKRGRVNARSQDLGGF